MHKLKAIITGAGIGGLSAAIALRQAGFEVEIYDRVKIMGEVGAGISLWSNGVKVLNQFGLGEKIAKIGGHMNRMQYRTVTGELLNDIELEDLIQRVGQRPYPVARADLQKMMIKAYGGEIKLDSRCIGVEEHGHKVTAIFDNGHRATGDVLIAADGVRSILRKYVTQEEIQPRYAGYVNWNGLVPASDDLIDWNSWVIYVGQHKRASMMPVGGDRFYFFFDVPLPKGTPCKAENYKEELTQYFQGWAQPVQNLISRLNPNKINRLEIHDLAPLNRFVRGRVAILGDAAHATCPDLGQGGCQALEDSIVLTKYLLTTNLGVEYALKRYEEERMERANAIVNKARQRAEMIHGKDPAVTQQWYEQLEQEKPEDVINALAKIILAGPLS